MNNNPVSNADLAVGDLVRYYFQGWRAGYVEAVHTVTVTIRPIPPRNGTKPRSITMPVTDVEKQQKK